MAAAPMTVAVHSKRRLVGEALAWCLATQTGLIVVGHTQQWVQLASLCRLRQPEALIADASTELDETIRHIRRLTTRCPVSYVVLLSDQVPQLALPIGPTAWRILPHSRGLGALLAALNDRSTARCDITRTAARAARLTEREVEVLAMVGSGLTAPEIANRLDIGHRSVENHKRRIYAKLGAHSQSGAVGAVAPLGILDIQPREGEARPASLPELSRRENEILLLSAQGASVRQIANSLGIAPKTVETQLSALYRKLGVHSRAAALGVARAHGLISEA